MTEEPNKDKFEISFRILGNEIFGMEILKSKQNEKLGILWSAYSSSTYTSIQ